MTYVYYNITSNLTTAGNSTTVLTFVKTINDTMNYAPALLILSAIIIVLFIQLISRGIDPFRSAAATCWVFLILSLILYPMGLVPGLTLIIAAILTPAAMALLFIFGGREYG